MEQVVAAEPCTTRARREKSGRLLPGGVLRLGNFRRGAGWAAAVGKIGVIGLHFHDLRHTGNMLAAPGASLCDLKGGWDTTAPAPR